MPAGGLVTGCRIPPVRLALCRPRLALLWGRFTNTSANVKHPCMSVSGAESGMIGNVAAAVVAHLLVAIGLFGWGRWVARRHKSAAWRRAAWMPLVAMLLSVVGVVVSIVMLIGAFGAVARVEAADKAQVLAQHISEAMHVTGIFLLPSALIYAVSFVAFMVGSFRQPRKTSDA